MSQNNQPLDVSNTVKSKADQLNVDDMLGQERFIVIEGVNVNNDPQQPIHIFYQGCNNIPYKPCLTVRRILIALWGSDANQWIGRAMNLYVDQTVSYGKQKGIGGIRVNAMSHIQGKATLKLTAARGVKKEHTINLIT